jgi:hypothetical protein
VLAAVVVSIVLAVASRERPARVLGVVGAAGLAFYLVTPTTALGQADQPLLFASNVRYASPVLALALALVPSHRVVRRAPVRGIVAGLLLGTLVIAQFAAGPFPGWPDDHRLLGLVVGAAVVLATVAALRAPRATVAVGAVVIVAFAYPIAHQYDVRRYATDSVARWANDVHGARIGIAGFGPQLDLAGRDFSNRVQYVAERGANGAFHEYASCGAWRRALRQGDYDYVVVAPRYPGAATHAVAWTASDPAASVVITNGTQTVYRFDRTVADPGC